MVAQMTSALKCFIFDLDGTLADDSHRQHHVTQHSDWDAYYAACPDDKPIEHMLLVARALQRVWPLIIITGRSEAIRKETEAWLIVHGIMWAKLIMRPIGDRRKNSEMKEAAVHSLRALGFEPLMAFEDLKPAVKLYRSLGIPCAHVADTPVWENKHPAAIDTRWKVK